MKKIVSTLVVMLLLFTIAATAQVVSVTGKVTDEKGEAVPFASILIKGSKTRVGTSADATGAFTIKAKKGDVLEISAIGFQPVSVTYTGQASIGTSLKISDNTLLKEVVITSAFETKRSSRSTSNSAQTVTADQLNTTRELSVNNALAGKVAGIQVQSQSSGKLGVETAVRIRGEGGVTSASSPLYVVNGTQMPSAADINPDDIESITVLQGPNAAALLGPAGANGAIVITTKRAKKGEKGIGVTVNSGVTVDKVYKIPRYQNTYAGGTAPDAHTFTYAAGMPLEWQPLNGKTWYDITDDASWGPQMSGQEYIPWYAWYPGTKYTGKTASMVPQPNNAREFYNTGVNLNNNVSFSKATDNVSTRISYGNIHQTGIIPSSSLDKSTLTTSTSIDLDPHLTLSANINYVTQVVHGEFNDGYSNFSSGSFNQWFHRDLDFGIMRELADLRSPYGQLASWNHSNVSSYNPAGTDASKANWYKGNYWYNPFSYFNGVDNVGRKDRLYGDLSLTYKINSDFKARFTYRKNQNTTYTENKTSSLLEASGTQTGLKASYSTQNSFSNRENYEGLFSYTKRVKDFDIGANVGFDLFNAYSNQVAANTNGGFSVDNLYALANSKNAISYSNARTADKYRAGFVTGNVGYKNFLFADFTLREDYYSELPASNNAVFIKSFGVSFVFSDLIGKSVPFLSFGKLRASWGEVPATLNAYDYPGFNYSVNANQYNSNFLMSTPNTIVDPTIHGAVNTARELGLDLKFLKNRVGLNVTYWDQTSSGFPITTSITPTSGFSGFLTNVGQVSKKGIDFTVNVKPIWHKDFQWDLTVNFSRIIEDKIISLGDTTVKQITYAPNAAAQPTFGGTYVPKIVQAVGQTWGQLYGNKTQMINGQPVLTSAGLYVRDATPGFMGSILPDYTGGVQNTFSYKNFVLSINIDFQKGGRFSSLSDTWGTYSGLTERTAATNDKGKNVRDDVAAGGGVHVSGVDATGKAVNYYVDAYSYFHQTVDVSQIQDRNIYDLTFVKLRELSIGYNFDVKKLGLSKAMQSLRLSLVSNNLWLIYSQTKDFDPSEISNVFGENAQYPGTRSIGANLKIGF